MGVDINTYRSRVGLFVSSRGAGMMMMPFVVDFSHEIKLIGAVSFIRILLIIAGIEQNPGPRDQLIYRYQYLLIEIGTKVLRKVFDNLVNNDFERYLNANPTQNTQLQFLMLKGIITDAQKTFLPPLDKKPTSSNFDITLLALLLRNSCGLLSYRHTVWTSPTDHSLEADIARLRECRNDLAHICTVYISEADLTTKWNELSTILKRLSVGRITNLSPLIDDAEHVEVDRELKDKFDVAIISWVEMDRLFNEGIEELKLGQSELKDGQSGLKTGQSELKTGQSELKDGQSELKTGQSEIKAGQSEFKTGQSEMKAELKEGQQSIMNRIENLEQNLQKCKQSNVETDFKNDLMEIYRKHCSTLPASPLCYEDEDEVDLLTVYQPPTMCHVPYHRQQSSVENYPISSYEEIFCKEDHSFRNIYITGDAGVGKTSFCQCMALLWCQSQSSEHESNSIMQKNIIFLARFEFVFYVSLRDSDHEDILDMIIDQFFYTKSKDNREEMYKSIEKVLKERECLIILDGLDEWSPKTSTRKVCVLPKKVPSKRCIHLTTCRPYIIENNRLSKNALDHQVQITGIHGLSSQQYTYAIVNHVNDISEENKDPLDFLREVKLCGLHELLSIPMITSQLIFVWFDRKLSGMSTALIYSTIVEMLFERAEMRKIQFPSPTDSKEQLPDCLSEFIHIKKHFSLLKEICLLSFRSLFKQDESLSVFVYTKELLMKEPYSFSSEKIDFLCKLGILSKNKVIGCFGKKEHKLSFLHKSYVDFFAALFVSSFDKSNFFDSVVKKWSNVRSVEQFQNFSLLLAGFCDQKVKFMFETICPSISDDLTPCRNDSNFCSLQVKSLQNIVIACFREIRRSNGKNIALKLKDFIFDEYCYVDSLKQLFLLNTACVQSIYAKGCKYLDEFDQINSLQCLHISDVLPGDYKKFAGCISQNESTLHTVCIKGLVLGTLGPELPLRRLQHLTSLSLSDVKMHHNSLCQLKKFLFDNVCIENIKLDRVSCDRHVKGDGDCAQTLNLPNHTKLSSLYLKNVTISCKNVNNSSLKSVSLFLFEFFTLFPPFSVRIVKDDIDVIFKCIEGSQLENLNIEGSVYPYTIWYKDSKYYYNTMKTVTSTVKTLQYIKSLTLYDMKLPYDVLLQLHPDVTQVKIKLEYVTMSRQCFHCFIESVVYNNSVIKVALDSCKISSGGETHKELSYKETVDYISEYLMSITTVNIRPTIIGVMLSFQTNCL